jgi:glycosyltransferase 2 family protein
VAALLSLAGVLIAVAGLAFVARSLLADWEETRELLRRAEWVWLALAAPVALAGMTAVGLPWRTIMAELGERHGVADTLRWYFPGQLGKYVPGGIWPVVGRGELAVRGGASRSVAYTSVALSLACTYLAATLVSIVFLMASVASGGRADGALWVLVLAPVGLALLHPVVLTRSVAVAERLLSRGVSVVVPGYRTIVGLVARHAPAWVLIGGATWLVARAFDPDPAVAQVLFAAVLSWVVGFVVIPVPGGIGVREAAFVAAATSLGSEVAATVAVASRLVFIAADLGGAGLALTLRSARR